MPFFSLSLSVWRNSPTWVLAASLLRFLDHTPLNAAGGTPLNEQSALHGGRYLHDTQQTQEMDISTLDRTRTHDRSNEVCADLHFWPPGHSLWRATGQI